MKELQRMLGSEGIKRGKKMITKELLELLFEAASIQRWNDHNRPEHFTELDKQAHKMIYAYVLAKLKRLTAHGSGLVAP